MRTIFAFASCVVALSLTACSGAESAVEEATDLKVAAATSALTPMPELPASFHRESGAGPRTLAFRYAEGSTTRGTYFMDTGIVCITYPCPSTAEGTFRVRRAGGETAVELRGVLGDQRPQTATFRIVEGAAGVSLLGTEGEEPAVLVADRPCVLTGCSGHVCADEAVITTCEYRPELACYSRLGICGRNAAGECGWQPTASLGACLENPSGCGR